MGILKKRAGTIIWVSSIGLALLLNISLFSLLPNLITPIDHLTYTTENTIPIDVIRIKKPKPMVRNPVKPKPRQEPLPKPKKIKSIYSPHPVVTQLKLPFEVNPRLSIGPQTLPTPDIEMAWINAPDLKELYGVNEIDSPLTPLVVTPPLYPLAAKRRGITGQVTLEFTILKNGKVDDIKIISAKPEGVFEQTALATVSTWRFKPNTYQGITVKTLVRKTIRFNLKK